MTKSVNITDEFFKTIPDKVLINMNIIKKNLNGRIINCYNYVVLPVASGFSIPIPDEQLLRTL
jgi:hypothetical protein